MADPVAAPDRDFPMIGETIGLWRLVAGLGRGGMGEVYEGEYDYLHILTLRYPVDEQQRIRHELAQLSRPEQARLAAEILGTVLPADARFAIKICNARSGTAGHRRFLQEAEMAERLGDHPYIVSVHAVNGGFDAGTTVGRRLELDRGRYRDVAFMVMDMATRTWDHTRLSIGEAVHIVRCIATALDHAHSKGVVHRDLKPENILGTIEHPLLTDFGIAKEIDQDEGLTRTGQIIGTLDYMSPEQATDAKRVDRRSDIYSLGVVLYEFATGGHLPYSHKLDRESCLAAIRSERTPPRWPREHLPDFPPGLERIILKAMAHRMADRYQAMSDFIHDLDRFTRGEWIGLWGRLHLRDWLRFQARFRPRVMWGSAVAALTAIALAVWILVVPIFDSERNGYLTRLQRFADIVADIRAGVADQPNASDQADLLRLHDDLADRRYPDLTDRRTVLDRELRAWRRLNAPFGSQLDNKEAAERIKIAAGLERVSWYLEESGLRIGSDLALTVGPYGRGSAVAVVGAVAKDWETFALEGREVESAGSLSLRWAMIDGNLRLTYQADGRTSVLREDPLPGSALRLAIELTATGVRTWVNNQVQTHRLPLISTAGGMRWTVTLPKGALLRQMYMAAKFPEARATTPETR